MALEKELQTYQAQRNQLLAHEGKFVLIHEDQVVGLFDTYADAIQAGYERFGVAPFLVKQIAAVEQIQFIAVAPCRL